METPHFAPAVAAFTAALDWRLAQGISSFPDLFQDDAVIDVPFDGDGNVPPIIGRTAIEDMAASLVGFLRFDEVTFRPVLPTDDPCIVVCEYDALLHRADHFGRLRRRYISVITLRDGRIAHLREYGGPFSPVL